MDTQYLESLKKPLIDEHYNLSDFDDLTAMVNKAYQFFARYPLIKQMGICDCEVCFHEPLVSYWYEYSGVQTIPDELLERYFSSDVVDENIVQQQMRALLPRLMDDFIQGKEFGILGRTGAFKWCQFSEAKNAGWHLEERQFMQEFAIVYFDIYINHPDGWLRFYEFNSAIEIVTMFYISGLNIQPLLVLWLSSLDELLACLYLGSLIRNDIENGMFYDVFAEEHSGYNNMIDTWLNDHAKEIASAFDKASCHPDFIKLDYGDRLCVMEGLNYFQKNKKQGKPK